MSLFPSGSSQSNSSTLKKEAADVSSWLQNPSFDTTQLHVPTLHTTSTPSRSPTPDTDHKPRTKKHKSVKSTKTGTTTSSATKKPNTIWLEESGLGLKDAYRVDRTPDRSNLSYDSLYSGSVAVYRRKFPVVGLDSQLSVVLDDGRGKPNKKKSKEKQSRYFSSELASIEELVLQGSAARLGDVVPFGTSQALTCESYSSQRVGEYNKALMDDLTNVPLWLEFIAAQDALLDWDQTGRKKQAMIERKIAIFERALASNPTSVELLLGHMALVEASWEPKAIVKRWKEMVFTQPNVPQLWLGYISYCQSNFAGFSTDSVAALYTKCISTLSMINEGTLKSHAPLPDSRLWTLTIFSRYCDFLKHCGMTERAVGSYQVLLELNLCVPSPLTNEPLPTLLSELSKFWDTSSPRIGEDGARGWMQHPTPLGPLDIALSSDPILEEDDVDLVSGLSEKGAWLKLEGHRCSEHWLPWREEQEPLDSERVVSFEVLKPALFRVDTPHLKLQLVLRFLSFLGALTPPLDTPSSHTAHTIKHPLELSSHLVSVFGSLLTERLCIPPGLYQPPLAFESVTEMVSSLSDSMLNSPQLTISPASTFISHVCHQSLSLLTQQEAQTKIALVWVCHSLKELAVAIQSGSLVKEKKKSVQKLVKSLLKLKAHRNNLELWRCCAFVEHFLGNDPFHIFNTLLSSSLTASLIASLVEIAIGLVPSLLPGKETDHSQRALNALLCLSEGKFNADTPVSPTRILRADFSCLRDDPFHTGLCRAYFEYLTKGVAPACRVLDELCDTLASSNEMVFSLQCKQVQLLLHSPLAQPKTLRAVLDAALDSFPASPWLLAQKLLLEEQSFSVGRIHKHTSQCPEAQMYRVLQELRRLDRMASVSGSSKGALRRAQALLETATENQSPLVWKVYLAVQALVDPSKLDALFYRAIHACPWSKPLYDTGAMLLSDTMLGKVVEVMEDKGIRLHSPLEEVRLLLVE